MSLMYLLPDVCLYLRVRWVERPRPRQPAQLSTFGQQLRDRQHRPGAQVEILLCFTLQILVSEEQDEEKNLLPIIDYGNLSLNTAQKPNPKQENPTTHLTSLLHCQGCQTLTKCNDSCPHLFSFSAHFLLL